MTRSVQDRLRDFSTDQRVLNLTGLAIIIGAISTGAAWLLLHLIWFVTNVAFHGRFSAGFGAPSAPSASSLGPWIVAIPAVGGLVIGLMARYGSEKIRGHGIPEALEAILIGRSRIEPKVAVMKPISSAISIGTGGPFGAEGPIIVTGGALGSILAQFFHLSAAERKTLLVAGAAGGMAATFGTPVAAVLLAVELLLFEWKPRSFIPVATASAVAAALRPLMLGAGVLFPVPAHPVLPEWALLICAGVGIAAGLASGILTALVYAFEDLFQRLPIHWMWWPALGGLAVGIGGLIYPRALGVGYDLIGDLLAGRGTASMIYGVLLVKSLIWAIALGSGTSGGVLAPLLMIGGALGVLESQVIPVGTSGFWALIGMAAIMGGTMRAPLTAMVFAVELTNDFHALLPLLVACSAAFGTTVLLLRRSILTEKLARRGQHITREYAIDPFEITRVGDIMIQDVDTIPGTTPVEQVVRFFTTEDRGGAARHKSYPVVDADGALLGMVSRGDAIRWLSAGWSHGATLADTITSNDTVFGYPDEPVAAIERRMAESGFGRIPVVRPENRVVVGIVSRKDLLHVRARLNAEEQERQSLLRVSRWATNVGMKPGTP